MPTFRGIAFPFGRSSTAIPASVSDDELVKQSIIQIVTTTRGERVMRPDFGAAAHAYVFENNNDILAELIRDEIVSAISRFEPRAIVQNVVTTREDNSVTITIYYVVSLTGIQASVSVDIPTNT